MNVNSKVVIFVLQKHFIYMRHNRYGLVAQICRVDMNGWNVRALYSEWLRRRKQNYNARLDSENMVIKTRRFLKHCLISNSH